MREDKFQLSSSRHIFISEQSSAWMSVVRYKSRQITVQDIFLVPRLVSDIPASQQAIKLFQIFLISRIHLQVRHKSNTLLFIPLKHTNIQENYIDDCNRSLKYHRKTNLETNLDFAILCTSDDQQCINFTKIYSNE